MDGAGWTERSWHRLEHNTPLHIKSMHWRKSVESKCNSHSHGEGLSSVCTQSLSLHVSCSMQKARVWHIVFVGFRWCLGFRCVCSAVQMAASTQPRCCSVHVVHWIKDTILISFSIFSSAQITKLKYLTQHRPNDTWTGGARLGQPTQGYFFYSGIVHYSTRYKGQLPS